MRSRSVLLEWQSVIARTPIMGTDLSSCENIFARRMQIFENYCDRCVGWVGQ